MDTFPALNPSYASDADLGAEVDVAKMGDGYEQRRPKGLNTERLRLNVVFDQRRADTVATVLTFLRAHNAVEAFLWTAPAPWNDRERRWILQANSVRFKWNAHDSHSLTFQIAEDFNPPL